MIHNWVDTPIDAAVREQARKILSSGYSPREKDQQLAALIELANVGERDRTKLVVVDGWFRYYRDRMFTTPRTSAAFI